MLKRITIGEGIVSRRGDRTIATAGTGTTAAEAAAMDGISIGEPTTGTGAWRCDVAPVLFLALTHPCA